MSQTPTRLLLALLLGVMGFFAFDLTTDESTISVNDPEQTRNSEKDLRQAKRETTQNERRLSKNKEGALRSHLGNSKLMTSRSQSIR